MKVTDTITITTTIIITVAIIIIKEGRRGFVSCAL